MPFELTSESFKQSESIPMRHTGDGQDQSPPLKWSEPPVGTKSFVLICDDPDAPRQTYVHWVVFNIPAETRELIEGVSAEQGLPSGTLQGTNDFDQLDYGGPAPPPGKPHRYFFKLYALDCRISFKSGATKSQVLAAIKGHELGECQLMGTYGRTKRP